MSMVFWFFAIPVFAIFDVPLVNGTWVPPLWFGVLSVPLGILVFFVSLHVLNGWGWVCARWAEVMFRGPRRRGALAGCRSCAGAAGGSRAAAAGARRPAAPPAAIAPAAARRRPPSAAAASAPTAPPAPPWRRRSARPQPRLLDPRRDSDRPETTS